MLTQSHLLKPFLIHKEAHYLSSLNWQHVGLVDSSVKSWCCGAVVSWFKPLCDCILSRGHLDINSKVRVLVSVSHAALTELSAGLGIDKEGISRNITVSPFSVSQRVSTVSCQTECTDNVLKCHFQLFSGMTSHASPLQPTTDSSMYWLHGVSLPCISKSSGSHLVCLVGWQPGKTKGPWR